MQDILDKIPESIRFKFEKDKEFYEKERLIFESDLFNEIHVGCVLSPRPETLDPEQAGNKELEKTKARPTSVLEVQEAEGYEFADPTPVEMSHVRTSIKFNYFLVSLF